MPSVFAVGGGRLRCLRSSIRAPAPFELQNQEMELQVPYDRKETAPTSATPRGRVGGLSFDHEEKVRVLWSFERTLLIIVPHKMPDINFEDPVSI